MAGGQAAFEQRPFERLVTAPQREAHLALEGRVGALAPIDRAVGDADRRGGEPNVSGHAQGSEERLLTFTREGARAGGADLEAAGAADDAEMLRARMIAGDPPPLPTYGGGWRTPAWTG